MKDFFDKLFSTTGFMPQGQSYLWKPEILWTHVIADGIIASSFFIIPLCLLFIARKRADSRYRLMLILFGILIYCYGATHIMNIVTTWNPLYQLEGIIKVI